MYGIRFCMQVKGYLISNFILFTTVLFKKYDSIAERVASIIINKYTTVLI